MSQQRSSAIFAAIFTDEERKGKSAEGTQSAEGISRGVRVCGRAGARACVQASVQTSETRHPRQHFCSITRMLEAVVPTATSDSLGAMRRGRVAAAPSGESVSAHTAGSEASNSRPSRELRASSSLPPDATPLHAPVTRHRQLSAFSGSRLCPALAPASRASVLALSSTALVLLSPPCPHSRPLPLSLVSGVSHSNVPNTSALLYVGEEADR